MRFGSLCSGIDAASVAFNPLGWKAAWFSEIEKFPSTVLAHHYPTVTNHGDMMGIRQLILDGKIEAPQMICGGPPCQSFSVAGLRKSLSDDRGNLTLEYIKICDANDKVRRSSGKRPAWILYENVPGILSTHDNAFGAFLGGLCGDDAPAEPGPRPPSGKSTATWTWNKAKNCHVPKWPKYGVVAGPSRVVAWRILDAQHFGLAQRRKRVIVLARGGAGRWAVADALLPIIKSSGWHSAPSRGKGEGTASGVERDFDENGREVEADARGLSLRGVSGGERGDKLAGVPKLQRGAGMTRAIVFDMAQVTSKVNRSNPKSGYPCHTLHKGDAPLLIRSFNTDGMIPEIAGTMKACASGGGQGNSIDHAAAGYIIPSYAIQERAVSENINAGPQGKGWQEYNAYTLEARHHSQIVASNMVARKLTPTEYCRLQGFPDDYLDILYRGKPAADGPKYKAIGNSWAVTVFEWVAMRISECSNSKIKKEGT